MKVTAAALEEGLEKESAVFWQEGVRDSSSSDWRKEGQRVREEEENRLDRRRGAQVWHHTRWLISSNSSRIITFIGWTAKPWGTWGTPYLHELHCPSATMDGADGTCSPGSAQVHHSCPNKRTYNWLTSHTLAIHGLDYIPDCRVLKCIIFRLLSNRCDQHSGVDPSHTPLSHHNANTMPWRATLHCFMGSLLHLDCVLSPSGTSLLKFQQGNHTFWLAFPDR